DPGLDNSVKQVIVQEVQNAVSASQQDTLNQITALIDNRLSTFQGNIQQSQRDISQSQMSKIEETLSENYTFQRKGNENQYIHEVKVLTKLTEAKSKLDGPDLSVESIHQARDKIVEGMAIVRDRQKLIKLADSSELGWKVVKEYTTNPIADDSENEKKMIRAQNRAERRSKNYSIETKCLLEVDIPVSPVGKLRSKLHEWKAITTSTHIIDVIENGNKLPLKTEPEVKHLKNNRSSLNNAKFVVEEIDKLLQKRCISEIYSKPTVVNPLTVAFNKNKPRLVLDCRHLNPHLFKFRYKYEDTKIARDLFQKGDYLFSFDIRSAYHHLEISDIHRTFLGFA
ncbi:uncharacterized protein LOC127706578, partial [Mytilus californianus]|uniref:uncharacterized protein LOC127706578 n=1 Tax=Mytilus californianus TaxID=6549 RepID=UPI00224809CC